MSSFTSLHRAGMASLFATLSIAWLPQAQAQIISQDGVKHTIVGVQGGGQVRNGGSPVAQPDAKAPAAAPAAASSSNNIRQLSLGVHNHNDAAPARPGDLQAAGACPPVAAASGGGNHATTVLAWARVSGSSPSGCDAGGGPGGGPRVTAFGGGSSGASAPAAPQTGAQRSRVATGKVVFDGAATGQ